MGGTVHGFLRDHGGRFTNIDPPGAVDTGLGFLATVPLGINDRGEILLPAPGGFYVQSTGTPGPLA